MASFIHSYGIRKFRPEHVCTLGDFQQILNDFRLHASTHKKESKKPKLQVIRLFNCPQCGLRNTNVSLMFNCSGCGFSQRLPVVPREPQTHFQTSLVRQFSKDSRSPKSMQSLTVETGIFGFNSGMSSKGRNIITVPGIIFWQTGFFLKLQKLINTLSKLSTIADFSSVMNQPELVKLLSLDKPLKCTPKQKAALAACQMSLPKDNGGDMETQQKIRFALGIMFLNLQEEELNYGSIASNRKGKHSWARQVVDSRRSKCTARAVITPANIVLSSEVSIPFAMHRELLKPYACYVLINRMPSLLSCNLSGHLVTHVNNSDTIGLPTAVLKGHGADFDGDAVSVYYPDDLASQIEIHMLMNCKTDIGCHSTETGLKLHPTNDHCRALKLVLESPGSFPSLALELCKLVKPLDIETLRTYDAVTLVKVVRGIVGDCKASAVFDFMVKSLKQISTSIPHSFRFSDLKALSRAVVQKGSIDVSISSSAPSLVPLMNERVTAEHLFQIVHELGEQHLPYFLKKEQQLSAVTFVKGNLLDGLSTSEQLFHSQSGFCNVVGSTLDVSANGYVSNKRASVFQDCFIDEALRLREANVIICSKPSEYLFATDIFPAVLIETLLQTPNCDSFPVEPE
ncbi:hypothetical protein HDE_12922 [Halotydeus destructor]|nr:hypothetical protein HDE_12922 [Halotydeus destructor]